MNSSLRYKFKNFNQNDQAIWMQKVILYVAVVFTLLCKLNYDHHNQTRFPMHLPNGILFISYKTLNES